MPNAGKKKNLKPKKERVNAQDFAKGFAMNVGDNNKALLMAQNYERAAVDQDVKNFWTNIKGHLNKLGA